MVVRLGLESHRISSAVLTALWLGVAELLVQISLGVIRSRWRYPGFDNCGSARNVIGIALRARGETWTEL